MVNVIHLSNPRSHKWRIVFEAYASAMPAWRTYFCETHLLVATDNTRTLQTLSLRVHISLLKAIVTSIVSAIFSESRSHSVGQSLTRRGSVRRRRQLTVPFAKPLIRQEANQIEQSCCSCTTSSLIAHKLSLVLDGQLAVNVPHDHFSILSIFAISHAHFSFQTESDQ